MEGVILGDSSKKVYWKNQAWEKPRWRSISFFSL